MTVKMYVDYLIRKLPDNSCKRFYKTINQFGSACMKVIAAAYFYSSYFKFLFSQIYRRVISIVEIF